MGAKYKESGGGPATGLANDWVKFLQGGLNSGSFGGYQPQGAQPYGGRPRPNTSYGQMTQGLNIGQQQGPMDNFMRADPTGRAQNAMQTIAGNVAGGSGIGGMQGMSGQNQFGGANGSRSEGMNPALGGANTFGSGGVQGFGGGMQNMMAGQQGLDPQAIAANPQGYAQFQQQAAQNGYNYGPQGQNMGGPNVGPSNPFAPQGQQQSQGGLGGGIDKFVNGDFNSPQWGVDTSGLQSQYGGFNFQPFEQSNVDFGSWQNPLQGFSANAQQVNPNIAQNENLQGSIGGLQNIGMSNPQDIYNFTKNFGSGAVPGAAPGVSMGNVNIAPYQALLDRRRQMGLEDNRARFGAAGGAAFGTPAAFAESNFLNENAATDAAAMADIGRAQQSLNLQEGQINSQNYNNWQDNVTRALQNQTGLFGSMYGNNIDALKGAGSLQLGALGQDASTGLANAGNNLQAQGLNLNALTNQGQLGMQNLNSQFNQNAQNQNAFNQYQGMQSNNQFNTNQLNSQNLAQALGLNLQGQGMNMNQGNINNQMQMGMLENIMNQMAGMAGKGITQRQGYMQPGFAQQALGAVTGLAGAAAPFLAPGLGSISGLFGGGGSGAGPAGGANLGGGFGMGGNYGIPNVQMPYGYGPR